MEKRARKPKIDACLTNVSGLGSIWTSCILGVQGVSGRSTILDSMPSVYFSRTYEGQIR